MGRNPGIYDTWEEVLAETKGFQGASFKKCNTREELEKLLKINNYKGADSEKNALELRQTDFLSSTNTLNIYVDGSFCIKSNIYSYAFAVVEEGEISYYESGAEQCERVGKELSNNSSELKAAMEAVNFASKKGKKRIVLYHDNLQIRNLVENPKPDVDGLWNKYSAYMNRKIKEENLSLNFTKVKAHNGNKFNEFVDNVAKSEMRLKRDGFDFLKKYDLDIKQKSRIRKVLINLLVKLVGQELNGSNSTDIKSIKKELLLKSFIFRAKHSKINLTEEQALKVIECNLEYAIDSVRRHLKSIEKNALDILVEKNAEIEYSDQKIINNSILALRDVLERHYYSPNKERDVNEMVPIIKKSLNELSLDKTILTIYLKKNYDSFTKSILKTLHHENVLFSLWKKSSDKEKNKNRKLLLDLAANCLSDSVEVLGENSKKSDIIETFSEMLTERANTLNFSLSKEICKRIFKDNLNSLNYLNRKNKKITIDTKNKVWPHLDQAKREGWIEVLNKQAVICFSRAAEQFEIKRDQTNLIKVASADLKKTLDEKKMSIRQNYATKFIKENFNKLEKEVNNVCL